MVYQTGPVYFVFNSVDQETKYNIQTPYESEHLPTIFNRPGVAGAVL